MTGSIPAAVLAERRKAEERTRALADICGYVNQALRLLHAAQQLNLRHELGLELPDVSRIDQQVQEAMSRCHAVHVLARRADAARGN